MWCQKAFPVTLSPGKDKQSTASPRERSKTWFGMPRGDFPAPTPLATRPPWDQMHVGGQEEGMSRDMCAAYSRGALVFRVSQKGQLRTAECPEVCTWKQLSGPWAVGVAAMEGETEMTSMQPQWNGVHR